MKDWCFLKQIAAGLAVVVLGYGCGGPTQSADSVSSNPKPAPGDNSVSTTRPSSLPQSLPPNVEESPTSRKLDLADFSLELPVGWNAYDLTSDDLDAQLKASGSDEFIAQIKPQIDAAKRSGIIKVVAFDLATAGRGFATNFSVAVMPAAKGITVEKMIEGNQREVKKMPTLIGEPAVGEVRSATVPMQYLFWVFDNGGTRMASKTLFAVKGGKQYTFSTVFLGDESANLMPVIDQIASSIRLK